MRLNSGSVVRSFGALALAALLAGPGLGISVASAQAPTSLAAMEGRSTGCASVNCLFFARAWGTMPTGFEFADGMTDITHFPVPDPFTGTTNGFFDSSQYTFSCNGPLWLQNSPARPAMDFGPIHSPAMPAIVVPLCNATSVPVVDASFLGKLSAAGYLYHLVFPIKDNGNSRGYVVWNSPISPERAGLDMPRVAGYARIDGVTWQDQFAPAVLDLAGRFIGEQSSPDRETTLRLEVPGWASTIGTDTPIYLATMVTDAWLAGTPTPPSIPLSPPSAPPGNNPAGPTNVTTPSSPAGSGTPSGGSDPSNPGSQYSWAAYCNSPNRDGTPRSADFVQSCLATHQH
jgi:hypothetical protein